MGISTKAGLLPSNRYSFISLVPYFLNLMEALPSITANLSTFLK